MHYDHYGVGSKWHAARRGTLPNLGWFYAGLLGLAYVLSIGFG